MKLIAHRGLTDGPNTLVQNTPDQIEKAFVLGYDSEIDVWYEDSEWYLGHDAPEHKIKEEFLLRPGLWIHCKNLRAWNRMRGINFNINYFWHENDAVTLTSQGICWTYLGRPETIRPDAVCVMPELTYEWDTIVEMSKRKLWYAMCTDFPRKLEECLK